MLTSVIYINIVTKYSILQMACYNIVQLLVLSSEEIQGQVNPG